MKTLGELIAYVGKKVVFDEKGYPELAGASEEKRLLFAVRHSALHFSKTAGKIAKIAEDVDHGGSLDIGQLKENIWKSFVNSLWLAEKAGMTEEEIVSAIENKYTK